jgi:SPX domain protein involved in polyphosphate accumulation
MTSPATGPLRLPDERLTADREETKYLVGGDRLVSLLALLGKHLPAHRFTGEGANLLPGAWHLVTTIYFDTPARTHYRAAVGDIDHNVKIRAKEYYDLHPSLAELATDPAEIVRYQPCIWFEMKRRDGARTIKHRFRLPKRDVPACLNGGQVVPDALELPASDVVPAESERAGIREIVAYCRALREPLAASCLVNYRRLSWQEPEGDLRVTLDSELAFYAVPEDLWQRRRALVRDALGAARATEPRAVLEIKCRGTRPAWLESLVGGAKIQAARFSKFVAAATVVHGEG